MYRHYKVISIAVISLLFAACKDKFAEYEDPSLPYNRQTICLKLSEILQEYDSPNDYKTKPISRSELAKYYKDYKIYGCEK